MERWRGLAVYLLFAFGLSWPTQIAISLSVRDNPTGMAALGGLTLVIAALLMWPPAIGAFVARRWVERGNFRDAGLRWPNWRYLVYAWFGPALLTLITMIASLPIYPFDSGFTSLEGIAEQAGQPLPVSPVLIVAVQIVSALTVAVLINCIFAFGEEFGWRGYLLPRLMERLGPWPGIIAHGAIWGFWHAPLIFLMGYNYPGHNVIGVPLFVVSGILMGALLAWLQLASRSVVPATVAHGALNAIAGLPLLLLRGVDTAIGGMIISPIGWVVMLIVIGLLVASGAFRRAIAMPAANRETVPVREEAV
jgi:membrane protease YdiL (CAAX protease family)